MASIDRMKKDGTFNTLSKKERLQVDRLRAKLEKNLGSISEMSRLPGALFVVDTMREHIAVKEAQKLNIPIFAMVDTNCDPRDVDYLIPSNDDASKSIKIIMAEVTDAVAEGLSERKSDKQSGKEGGDVDNGEPQKKKKKERISEKATNVTRKDKAQKIEGKDSTTEIDQAPVVAQDEGTPKPTPETVETQAPPVVGKTPKPEVNADPIKADEKQNSTASDDDLTKIEGIGPKAAEALVAAKIDTYAKLAKSDPEKIKEALNENSTRMAHLDPTSWSKQADLAANGKWDELQEWQDKAKGGVE